MELWGGGQGASPLCIYDNTKGEGLRGVDLVSRCGAGRYGLGTGTWGSIGAYGRPWETGPVRESLQTAYGGGSGVDTRGGTARGVDHRR